MENSFSLLVLVVGVLLMSFLHKLYGYINFVENYLNDMDNELEKHKDVINEILNELDEDEEDMYEFYVIDKTKSLEENMKLRDEYYTKEVLDSYDTDTRNIIEECVLDDEKFELLYDIKAKDQIRFIELSQRKFEILSQM